MVALKRVWLLVLGTLIATFLYISWWLLPHQYSSENDIRVQLDLLSHLLVRDIEFARLKLVTGFQQAPKRLSSDWLETYAQQSYSEPLAFQGLVYRVRGKPWTSTSLVGSPDRLPRKLEELHWLCQPSCQLLIKASRGAEELVAIADLEQWLQRQEQLQGIELKLASSIVSSIRQPGLDSVERDIGLYFSSRQHGDWIGASRPVLSRWPVTLSGQRISHIPLSLQWYVLLLLVLTALLGTGGLAYYQYQQQKQWRQIFEQYGLVLSHIESGTFSEVKRQLVAMMKHAPKLAHSFVRKLALYGLQDESTRQALAQVTNDKDWLSEHDGMTGLANRESFYHCLKYAISKHECSALLLIDIDDFKEINDASGHQLGNDMLMKLAAILAEHVTLPNRSARIAGDEFAVWMPGSSLEQGEQLAGVLLEASRQIMLAGNKMLHRLSLSVGVVVAPEHGAEPDVLMTRADMALNYSKSQGKGRYASLRDPDLEGYLLKQRFMYSRVHSAIRDQRLALAYQPIVRVSDGCTSHYEVLLRIEDDMGNYVSAYPLIQAAERQRDVGVLDKWVLNQVLTLLMQLRRNHQRYVLAVNISGMSMSDAQLTETLLQRIEFSGCAEDLVVEITESAALENIQLTQKNIERLQSLGCKVALDDFGVGYSSVNNLLSLPFDYVKVDGCFIRKLTTDEAVVPLLEFLVNISKLRGFQLVAEFVENEHVAQRLEQIGVQFAQGYFYGKPELGRLALEQGDSDSLGQQYP